MLREVRSVIMRIVQLKCKIAQLLDMTNYEKSNTH